MSILLKDIDGRVPNIKNIQPKGEYYKFINIIRWNEVTLNDYLKFDFSDGIIEEGRLKGEVFSGSVLLATVIRFVDVNLENKLIYILNKTEDTRITDKDMINITQLNLSNSEISNLSGMEYASNIDRLDLSNNNLQNINELSNMKKLQYLDISYNKLSDLTPLFELENLKEVISTNQKIIYPVQFIRGNGEVKVLLDLLTCGVEYSASIKNISNLGYRQGNAIIWRNVISNTTLKFDYEIQLNIGLNYKLSNGENRKTILNIITSGKAEVPTMMDNITRGINIFSYEKL